MTYHVTTDADNDPTIWDTSESELFPRAILRRSDLPETARELWPVICEAVTGEHLSRVFDAVIRATTDDPTGHLSNCGYTHENQTCGCAAWGYRLRDALKATLTLGGAA